MQDCWGFLFFFGVNKKLLNQHLLTNISCCKSTTGAWLGRGRAGQGRTGQGRAGQARAGQGRAGQGLEIGQGLGLVTSTILNS